MSKSEYKRFAAQMPEVFKVIRNSALDEAIAVTIKEPDEIRNSSSYRQGYVRAVNDKAKAIEALKNE